MLRTTTPCTFSTSELPKMVRTPAVFNSLTSKCASHHNAMHFFDISMSKSGPRMLCFVHFDFEMCFAPKRRALFRRLNFQKWSENWCVLYILTSKCASRHNGLQFFSSHLASWLRIRLASLLFDPLEPQTIGKTQCFATFLPFRAPASSFFWLFLFSDLLSSALLFSILLLHLCFSSVHIVGSLTSKLPSTNSLPVVPHKAVAEVSKIGNL